MTLLVALPRAHRGCATPHHDIPCYTVPHCAVPCRSPCGDPAAPGHGAEKLQPPGCSHCCSSQQRDPHPASPGMEDEGLWRCPDIAIPTQGTPKNRGGVLGTSCAACAWSPRSVPTTPAAPLGSSAASGSAGSAASPRQKVRHRADTPLSRGSSYPSPCPIPCVLRSSPRCAARAS